MVHGDDMFHMTGRAGGSERNAGDAKGETCLRNQNLCSLLIYIPTCSRRSTITAPAQPLRLNRSAQALANFKNPVSLGDPTSIPDHKRTALKDSSAQWRSRLQAHCTEGFKRTVQFRLQAHCAEGSKRELTAESRDLRAAS